MERKNIINAVFCKDCEDYCNGYGGHFVCGAANHECQSSWGCCGYCKTSEETGSCDGNGNYHTCGWLLVDRKTFTENALKKGVAEVELLQLQLAEAEAEVLQLKEKINSRNRLIKKLRK